VVVVDDDAPFARGLAEHLEAAGYLAHRRQLRRRRAAGARVAARLVVLDLLPTATASTRGALAQSDAKRLPSSSSRCATRSRWRAGWA
jgi:hypothetical protein